MSTEKPVMNGQGSASDAAPLPRPLSDSDLEKQPQQPVRERWWMGQVDPKHGDLALFACCFVTGLLDCSVFKNWATFVGMQTGNTVILCLSTAGFPLGQPWAWATTLISIISFFLGAFFTTRVSNLLGPKRRTVLVANFFLQSVLIILAAALATGNVLITDHGHDSAAVLHDPRIMIAIAPLAWQSGATIATSRLLGFGNEIPVTVYTSTYAALAADPKLFQIHGNYPRNRRITAVICVLSGAMIATWIEKKSIGMIAIFWMGAGIKLVISVAVAAFLPAKPASPAATK